MFFGTWEYGSPDDPALEPLMLIFVVFTILFPIIIFNLLIALITDSYTKAIKNNTSDDAKIKLEMILEVMELRIFKKKFTGWCLKKKNLTVEEKAAQMLSEYFSRIEHTHPLMKPLM